MKNKGYLALAAVALALLAATAVRADVSVNISYAGYGPYRTVNIRSDTPPEDANNIVAGSYNHIVPFGTPFIERGSVDGVDGKTRMFCLDIIQNPESLSGSAPYTLTRPENAPRPDGGDTGDSGDAGVYSYPMGDVRADWLAVLAHRYWTDAWLDNGTAPAGHTYTTNVTQADRYAALQVAIWEIIFEGVDADAVPSGWDVDDNTGDFYISYANDSNVLPLADIMLDWCEANFATATRATLGALVSDQFQDMLVRTSREVPEPSAFALAGLGLLGLITRRRKRS